MTSATNNEPSGAPGSNVEPLAATLVPASTQTEQSSPSLATLLPDAPKPLASTGSGFDEETRRLLHYRLYCIHGAVCVVMAGLLCMDLLGDSVLSNEAGLGRWTRGFPWLVFIESLVGVLYLRKNPDASLRALRRLELGLFVLFVSLASIMRYKLLTTAPAIASPDPRFTDLALRYNGAISNLSFSYAILIYGVLIPNTRRRSVQVVLALCAIPLLVTAAAGIAFPAVRESLKVIVPFTALHVFMAGVIGVVSAARTQTLRREAFEARREAQQVGPYTLKRKLGAGGMGDVYLAEHRLLKRPCAVKFVRADLAANASNALRFEREVRAMTALTHFNTVRVYDYGRAEDGSFYYVMEYLDGLTLDALMRESGPLEPARAVYLLRQVCGALAEAHAAGLVHRDLKPGNIVVATQGGQYDVAKLLDFGLVQDLGAADTDPRLTQTGTVLGTPAYMSPEQAGGDGVIDARGDIYSLGAVAFFALTGRPPFEGQSIGKLLAAHLTQPPPFVTEVRKDVPLDLAKVVERCLAKSPADRFPSATELESALGTCPASAWSASHAATWWKERHASESPR